MPGLQFLSMDPMSLVSPPNSNGRRITLKGQCHEIFCFRFFSWITFPQAPENNIRVISNFFENSRRYSQVKVHHRCQRHRWQCHWHRDTGGKFATGINDTGGKFCHQFRLCCWHHWQICHRCQRFWHRWQIMGTISGCRHLKVNLKAKIYIYVNSTTKRCPKKIIKIFLLEDFLHLPLVLLTPVVHLEPRISPRIFEKIWNGRNDILTCLGETDSWKKIRSRKSRDTVPLSCVRKETKRVRKITIHFLVPDLSNYSTPLLCILI